jgi:hypothetical protein
MEFATGCTSWICNVVRVLDQHVHVYCSFVRIQPASWNLAQSPALNLLRQALWTIYMYM